MPDDDAHITPHVLAERRNAMFIQHHIRIDLNEKWRFHLCGAGIERFVKGDDIAHHDYLARAQGLAMYAGDRVFNHRLTRAQHEGRNVDVGTSKDHWLGLLRGFAAAHDRPEHPSAEYSRRAYPNLACVSNQLSKGRLTV